MTFVEEENEKTIEARRKLSIDEADEERRTTFDLNLQKQNITKSAFLSIFNKGVKNLENASPTNVPPPRTNKVTEINDDEDSSSSETLGEQGQDQPTEEERPKARSQMRSPDREVPGPQVTITDQEVTPKVKTTRKPDL